MMRPGEIYKSSTFKYLLFGFLTFIVLLITNWLVTSRHLEEQMKLNQSNVKATEKMHIVTELIEIARKRTRLSHQMLLSDDVFEKDELSMKINSLALDFIENRNQLLTLQLSLEEQQILDSQLKIIPGVIADLERIADLAIQDTNEATVLAREIIIRDITPVQTQVIDGLTRIMRLTEDKVYSDIRRIKNSHHDNHYLRLLLLLIIVTIASITLYFVGRKIIITEKRLGVLSSTDELTGLLNRRGFQQYAVEELRRASRDGKPVMVMLIDIDHFKLYNDAYGHQQGDNCLQNISKSIQSIGRRSGDLVARYGGEEFIVFLPDVDALAAKKLSSDLLQSVRSMGIKHEESPTCRTVTVSIGYISLVPSGETSLDDIILQADIALYKAKNGGRDRAEAHISENT